MIKSVYTSDKEILESINSLYLQNKGFDLDPTYGRGNIYKGFPEPKIKGDINPQFDDVLKLDSKFLHINNALAKTKIKRIMFDPPFLVRSSTEENKSHMCKLYSYFETKDDLLHLYYCSLHSFNEILQPKGIVVFKCQDYSDGRRNHFIHVEVCNLAERYGFKAIDLFIKVNEHVIHKKGSKQGMARKVHTYFWVFRKV
jgi:tRNA G10  N-methylase Trm11